ncbi:hypothetical protein [Myxosarcina sp. GI1]|uniref:hypothetical protein n=1 Tax=Myxosarcina sp. GI1 TaxID=1541065 RepID=UPI000569A28A|nr:hypothetical protein [Myxosarcina sp. GI1]
MSDNKNATGKSSTAKPNTNAEGQIDVASKSVNPEAITKEAPAAERAEEAPENQAATKREKL